MNILHLRELCRVVIHLRNAQRKQGHHADVVSFGPQFGDDFTADQFITRFSNWNQQRLDTQQDPLNPDWVFHDEALRGRLTHLKKTLGLAKLARQYDLLHWHAGLYTSSALIHVLSRRPAVVHYHGADIALGRAARYQRLARKKYVSTPNLLRYVPDAEYFPNPFLPTRKPVGLNLPHDGPIRIGHFPTNPERKGTAEIEPAIQRLARHHPIEYVRSHGEPYEKLLDLMASCHIIIDQHMPDINAHGVVSLEALSLGKIAVCSIDTTTYPQDIPIIPTRNNVHDALTNLLERQDEWLEIAAAGPNYVHREHHPDPLAKRLLDDYETILAR